jgi:Zn-dependent alcohol dehydrogenase
MPLERIIDAFELMHQGKSIRSVNRALILSAVSAQ